MNQPTTLESYDWDIPEERSFTARDLLVVLFKHWRIIVSCFGAFAAASIIGLTTLPPTYIAEAKLLVRTEQQGNPSFLSGIAAYREPRESDPVVRKLETEMELLSTRGLAEKVVDDLQLRWEDVYHPAYVHLLRPIGDTYAWVAERWFGQAPDPEAYGRDATVAAFQQSFTAQPLKSRSAETTSNIVGLTFKASSSHIAQSGLNALMNAYLQSPVADADRAGRDALAIVDSNLEEAATEMAAAQQRVQDLLAREGASLAGRGGAETLRGELPRDEVSIGTMKSRLIEMELKLVELRQTYLDSQPAVVMQQQAIGELRNRINQQTRASAASESSYGALLRDLRAAEQFYLELRKKRDQIVLFLKLNPSQIDNRVVAEPPLLPRSSEWKKSAVLAVLGAIAGLIFGLGVAAYREYADQRLQRPEDVLQFLGMPVLGVIGALGDEERWKFTGRR